MPPTEACAHPWALGWSSALLKPSEVWDRLTSEVSFSSSSAKNSLRFHVLLMLCRCLLCFLLPRCSQNLDHIHSPNENP